MIRTHLYAVVCCLALLLPHQGQASPVGVGPTYLSTPAYDVQPSYWDGEEGVGHFSEWSKATKRDFIDDVRAGKADQWVIVMGNEGGDLDSMTAALTWSYHLSHMSDGTNTTTIAAHQDHSTKPIERAIALLQTPLDALDLRPENKLALHNVQMSPGHRDLLTIDELPISAEELAKQVQGIVLVDHPVPLSVWTEAKVLSIFDHHKDRGIAPGAKPRIFEATASCTTLVARQMLDELETLPEEYHMPHEVVELILDAIALDSDGLRQGTPEDKFVARRLLKRSNWRKDKLLDVMERLDDEMSKAKKDLASLSVRDLLRRDWKGDLVRTRSKSTSEVHLGLASIPYSLDQQIRRTLHENTQSWFDIEEHWTSEIHADVSLSLNSYKEAKFHVHYRNGTIVEWMETEPLFDDDEDGDRPEEAWETAEEILKEALDDHDTIASQTVKRRKTREICLVVRASHRLEEATADSLFDTIKANIDESPFLDAEPWHGVAELKRRQMVWVHHVPNGGRKLVRPIVEEAVQNWS